MFIISFHKFHHACLFHNARLLDTSENTTEFCQKGFERLFLTMFISRAVKLVDTRGKLF